VQLYVSLIGTLKISVWVCPIFLLHVRIFLNYRPMRRSKNVTYISVLLQHSKVRRTFPLCMMSSKYLVWFVIPASLIVIVQSLHIESYLMEMKNNCAACVEYQRKCGKHLVKIRKEWKLWWIGLHLNKIWGGKLTLRNEILLYCVKYIKIKEEGPELEGKFFTVFSEKKFSSISEAVLCRWFVKIR
jgi:hypothetical protein